MDDVTMTITRKLQESTAFADIFGALPSGGVSFQKSHLKKQYHVLAKMVHPDSGGSDSAFRLLNAYMSAAQRALDDGSYVRKFAAGEHDPDKKSSPETGITSAKASYKLENKVYRTGDFSAIYRTTDKKFLVKIVRSPKNNQLLEYEDQIIKKFKSQFPKLGGFVPDIVDSFLLSQDSKRYRVNVMTMPDGYVSLVDIKNAYPKGLDPKHCAWIFRRVLSQAVAAQSIGHVHSSIVPDHVLVHPVTHDPIHLGWAHSLDTNSPMHRRVSIVIDRWKAWYPKEVFDKKKAEHWFDVYMSAKTMIYLLGGDVNSNAVPSSVPKEINQFLLKCLKKGQQAEKALEEFTSIIRKLWGRSYKKLEMP